MSKLKVYVRRPAGLVNVFSRPVLTNGDRGVRRWRSLTMSCVRDDVRTATRAETTSPAHACVTLTFGFGAAFAAACAAAGARRAAHASTAATRKWCEADKMSPWVETNMDAASAAGRPPFAAEPSRRVLSSSAAGEVLHSPARGSTSPRSGYGRPDPSDPSLAARASRAARRALPAPRSAPHVRGQSTLVMIGPETGCEEESSVYPEPSKRSVSRSLNNLDKIPPRGALAE